MAVDYVSEEEETEEAPREMMTGEQILAAIMNAPNIAEALQADPQKLPEIAAKVIEDYDIDEGSRRDWLKRNKEALDLAMLVAEQKDYPFERAANVKYPLLTTAAFQFNARAYPAIVMPDRVVKCKVRGRDPQGAKAQRADRVSEHMSDQLLHGMPEWEEDTDRILVMLPIVGCVFRKVWYDPALKRKVSRLVTAEDLVVNYKAASLHTAPRVTEILRLYPYEIEERIRDGRFLEFDYEPNEQDTSAPHEFLEQHRLLDLDEDGYPEPYIVTVHKETQQVCRIVANFTAETVTLAQDGRIASIRKQDYYVHYQFLPNPEGGFYGLGFGWLLSSTNETINSTLNQLMDAGHLANMQGGLISSVLGLKDKKITLKQGEWRVINANGPLNQAVMPIKYGEPSQVLFNLLGLLIDAGRELSATKDVLTGESPSTAPVGTTLAMIEQGLQVFTAIYKRVHRALKHELQIHARLNAQFLTPEEYSTFFDEPVDPKADYSSGDMDILPISDPGAVTKMQKLAKAQLVLDSSQEKPFINQVEAHRRFYEAADIEDIDELFLPPPQPDPAEEAFLDAVKKLGLQEQVATINEKITKALKNIADAEAAEEGQQLDLYAIYLQALQAEHQAEQDVLNAQAGAGGLPGMEGGTDNQVGAGPLPQAGGGGEGLGGPPVGPDIGQSGMAGPASAGGIPQGAL